MSRSKRPLSKHVSQRSSPSLARKVSSSDWCVSQWKDARFVRLRKQALGVTKFLSSPFLKRPTAGRGVEAGHSGPFKQSKERAYARVHLQKKKKKKIAIVARLHLLRLSKHNIGVFTYYEWNGDWIIVGIYLERLPCTAADIRPPYSTFYTRWRFIFHKWLFLGQPH